MDVVIYITIVVSTSTGLTLLLVSEISSIIIGSILLSIGTLLTLIVLLINCFTKKETQIEDPIPVATVVNLEKERGPITVVIGIPA